VKTVKMVRGRSSIDVLPPAEAAREQAWREEQQRKAKR
jgi:hypothetical protein